MFDMTAEEITRAVGGLLMGEEENFANCISIDSKKIKPQSLFIPIRGNRVDSHKFIEEAFKAGASISFSDQDREPPVEEGKTIIRVRNTIKALQDLAEYFRVQENRSVVGVTGSVGKTTTKEMIYEVLSGKYRVAKTSGNKNGQIGVPLSILDVDYDFDMYVLEMGISRPGEMEVISRIAQPNYIVIGNIGVSHIGNFYDFESLAAEKMKIAKYSNNNSILFFNGDDPYLKRQPHTENTIFYGTNSDCDIQAKNLRIIEDKTLFDVSYQDATTTITIPCIGKHYMYDALAAIAVGLKLGVTMEKIQKGLLEYTNLDKRQKIYELKKITLIDDTYNSCPDSVKAGIDLLKILSKGRKTIAILGDMLELGDVAQKLHEETLKYAKDSGVEEIFVVGEISKDAVKDSSLDIKSYKDPKSAAKEILPKLPSECVILVKGSRGVKMEDFVKEAIKHCGGKRNTG